MSKNDNGDGQGDKTDMWMDEAADLQAALALSLRQSDDSEMADTENNNNVNANGNDNGNNKTTTTAATTSDSSMDAKPKAAPTPPPAAAAPPKKRAPPSLEEKGVLGSIQGSSKPFDIGGFHDIMWGPTSTDSDKQRWVGQGIDVNDKTTQGGNTTATTTTNDSDAGNDTGTNTIAAKVAPSFSSRLSMVGSTHGPWGLVQEHGGPCGVLAAVQAELLRVLLFGMRDPVGYPASLTRVDESSLLVDDEIDEKLLEDCLAMSIAVIIARVTLMPPATGDTDGSNSNSSTQETIQSHLAKLVLPSTYADDCDSATDSGIAWQDLAPWDTPATHGVLSESLYEMTVQVEPPKSSASTHKRSSGSTNDEQSHDWGMDDKVFLLSHWIQLFLLTKPNNNPAAVPPIHHFRKPGGVVLLVMSLVASRGASVIQLDMDDPTSTKLTSQFGHCGQELMNLLLTGQAVSNVFDNTMTLSGSLQCKGPQQRPAVGYLSQLEALRYCQVGGYYKNPRFPIWVVGSTSHFTVLFGDGSCLKESKSDELLEQCQRAFRELDREENGFISRLHLGDVYKLLDLDVGSDHALQTLAASLEVNGADIILWDDFWKATSRLMTGASIESVLQGDVGGSGSSNSSGAPTSITTTTTTTTASSSFSNAGSDAPPLLLRQFGEPSAPDSKPAAMSDEELAKKLAEEWNNPQSSGDIITPATPVPATAAIVSPFAAAATTTTKPPEQLTDEEFARQLQAEWNGTAATSSTTNQPGGVGVTFVDGVGGTGTGGDVDNASVQAVGDDQTTGTSIEDEKMTDPDEAAPGSSDFEKYGDTFPLYHYNGMRGGTLTSLQVTRLTAIEAVGASIGLGNSGAGGGGGGGGSGAGGDLEDVVRTKWPSCMLNWHGKAPPYID